VLALALAGWSWSYVGNRQLVQNVQADLDKAVKLQQGQTDLASRLQAMELLQNRVEQLDAWREGHPWSVGLGLYQGEVLERKLRSEYFHGVRELMLKPVSQAIEGYLGEVNRHAAELKPIKAVEAASSRWRCRRRRPRPRPAPRAAVPPRWPRPPAMCRLPPPMWKMPTRP
jgi:type VI secretion system protein ImpL